MGGQLCAKNLEERSSVFARNLRTMSGGIVKTPLPKPGSQL
jgi:hypothetical protein